MLRTSTAIAMAGAIALYQPNVRTEVPREPASSFPTLQHLRPGEPLDIAQEMPITVVFVGLEPGASATAIDTTRLLASQLSENRVGDRVTRFYERGGFPRHIESQIDRLLEPSYIGLTYRYSYRTVFADATFENGFFDFVTAIAAGPFPNGTIFQQAYSEHPLAAQQITESYLIDATAAEWWLATHAGPMLGVDTTRPTVFFINWFGRPDFRFHTYAFLHQPPDYPFPIGRTQIGQMAAWGGSPAFGPYGALGTEARIWFYDVSAGPTYSTVTWLLDAPDVDGDGVTDERLAPIWEYGTTHWYRPFNDLTSDLARLLRYVAVDTLFGASPIYDPAISEPLLVDRIELDLNLFAGRAGRDPATTLRIQDLPAMLSRLDPTREFVVDAQTWRLEGGVNAAYDCFESAFSDNPRSCFGNRSHIEDDPSTPFHDGVLSDLDLYFLSHDRTYLDGTRYEIPLAVFDVPDERVPPNSLLGLASSRAPNLQAWTYGWLTDRGRASVRTDTMIVAHETGHHLGLSHVHDTFDPGTDQDLSAEGPSLFLFSGMETFTTMSYLPNVDEFGQFDRDHMARWQLAARLDNANRILGDIERSPRGASVADLVVAADAKAGDAIAALQGWKLPAASAAAAEAYRLVLAAAAAANVKVEPYSGVADQSGAGILDAATDPRDLNLPKPAGRPDGLLRYIH